MLSVGSYATYPIISTLDFTGNYHLSGLQVFSHDHIFEQKTKWFYDANICGWNYMKNANKTKRKPKDKRYAKWVCLFTVDIGEAS